jgi:hypothetical protein
MKALLIDYLPEYFRSGPGELNSTGQVTALSCWGILFLTIGVVLGCLYLRKSKVCIQMLERENEKGFNRLEIYRATVEKQSESSYLRD